MIIIAINNEKAFEDIKLKIEKDTNKFVYNYDITTREETVELLHKINKNLNKSEELVLITTENLSGNINTEKYIEQIKMISKKIKIIYFTSRLSESIKKILLSNEIFNIIEATEYDPTIILNNITQDSKLIYKYKYEPSIRDIHKHEQELDLKKEFIAVYGASGSGKSYISDLLSKNFCYKYKSKTCLVDMDFENSSIDILNNLHSNDSSVSKIAHEIELNKSINSIISNATIKKNSISYILNNTSMYEYKNKINTNHYLKIYNELNKNYNTIIVDLPSFPFIDVVSFTLNYATKIIFVVNPNYLSLRQSIRYLEFITKHFDIPKEIINIIINKSTKNSLSNKEISQILYGYTIINTINYNTQLESSINMESCVDYEEIDLKNNKSDNNILDKFLPIKNKIKSLIDNSKRSRPYDNKLTKQGN